MLVPGIIMTILGALATVGGFMMMRNAKKKVDEKGHNETVAYMETQKRKGWGATLMTMGLLLLFVGIFLIMLDGMMQ